MQKKSRKVLTCSICGTVFTQNAPAQKYCSEQCHIKAKNMLARQRLIENSKKEFSGVEGVDFVECKICGQRMKFFQRSHLDMHNISKEDYEKQYGEIIAYPSSYIDEHFKGENNPNSSLNADEQSRKERSPFSKEYYKKRGLNESDRTSFCKNIKRSYNTTLEYYTNKGYSEKEAKGILSERQRTFTLEKCIQKYGEVEGRLIWENRQDKWKLKMFADGAKVCCGQSKACSMLTNMILEKMPEGVELLYGKNEFRLFVGKNVYLYDITNPSSKRIIEFNGDIWHGNPKIYKATDVHKITKVPFKDIWEKDKIKLDIAKLAGYEVLTIWESDFYKDKEETAKRCIDFILG